MIDRANILLIISVLTIVFVVGFWIPYRQNQNNPTPVITGSNHGKSIEIAYTSTGFEPSVITIDKGTTVVWKNLSGRPLWVASDPHPAHTNLPSFDQKEIINKLTPLIKSTLAHGSGVYEYTFTIAGKWEYHNHINPAHRGVVNVVESNLN